MDYQLSDDGGLFAVSDNGVIRLAGQLDREAVAQYNITITVTDRSATAHCPAYTITWSIVCTQWAASQEC